jgi:hypothetical protein
MVIKVEAYRTQAGLMQCNNCQKFGHVWANCRQPLVVCGLEAATSIKSTLRRTRNYQPRAAASVSRERGKNSPLKLSQLQIHEGGAAAEEGAESPSEESTWESVLFQVYSSKHNRKDEGLGSSAMIHGNACNL